ncbi:hypothetical protein LAV84_06940 [Rhizobium sp. VS19-DR104.2]|uniref:hypothetical protein n=1 Tax=unclassified Rhizobium TaxID=2613769 RepID=UPI001CC34D9A|nr:MULTISPECIES: hypothetical protein [unclassified Rhizobium]MBZ5760283.1 hypothetical protein [Rhizobium sp. VS19-DR96]MBZ5766873.1 hypothetical protein [Rhizobium sp. VS19-DR129.2]MBZ5773134.1 hypothetical protein [Rhizobium sp. VS19-DRK62.2]MBZ5784118.1 hypothetical protein [Rhizobium sp. VS19-DR121]MBZ5802478.1 hypothetical protein [Rhizobium sp. VS19-DR181]
MRTLSANNYAALQARRLVARDFLWLKVRTLLEGAPFEYGFWSDVSNVSAPILDPNTGLAVTRNFEGSGTLIQISDIPLVSNLTVQNITITMSQLDDGVANIVRGYDLKQAGVEIHRGLFDPDTRQLIDAAIPRFVGFVDEVVITTPKEGDEGAIELTCAPHTQELFRSNPETRSQDSQVLRRGDDNFFQDTTTVGDWEFFWGRKTGKVQTAAAQRVSTSVRAANR